MMFPLSAFLSTDPVTELLGYKSRFVLVCRVELFLSPIITELSPATIILNKVFLMILTSVIYFFLTLFEWMA